MAGSTFDHERAPAAPTPAAAKPPAVAAPRPRPPLAAVIQRARLNPRALTREDVAQLHRSIGNAAVGRLLASASAPNRTGLPDGLKADVEARSGLPMDDVRVHYNSPEPAAVQAHAYARGTEIHLAPGQERHLPHEAWHVVQQKQGRVRAATQVGGVPVNDDVSLEHEASTWHIQLNDRNLENRMDNAAAGGAPSGREVLQLVAADRQSWGLDSNFNLQSFIAKQAENQGEIEKGLEKVPDDTPADRRKGAEAHRRAPLYQKYHSVGFEFEFALYDFSEELDEHVELAESQPLSSLFGLKFILETDAGSVLEIGFPPFLFPDLDAGKPDLAMIQSVYDKSVSALGSIVDEAKLTLPALVDDLDGRGLGRGWKHESRYKSLMMLKHKKNPVTGTEFVNPKINFNPYHPYAQMNISMRSDEVSEMIVAIDSKMGVKDDETRRYPVLRPRYDALLNIPMDPENKILQIHVARAFANLSAIPDIAFEGMKIVKDILPTPGHAVQSTVKEMTGVWIKESLVNVIGSMAPLPSAFSEYVTKVGNAAQEFLQADQATMIRNHQDYLSNQVTLMKTAIREQTVRYAKLRYQNYESRDSSFSRIILTLSGYANYAHDGSVQDAMQSLIDFVDPVEGEDDRDFKECSDRIGTDDFPALMEESYSAHLNLKQAGVFSMHLVEMIYESIRQEMEALVTGLTQNTRAYREISIPRYGAEKFGEGAGVRKDTYIVMDKEGASGDRHVVAEVRGSSVIKAFLTS